MRPHTPQQALQRLIKGNERFIRGKAKHGNVSQQALARLRCGQNPFAVILGCSDSRVPPELVFDQGFGDLFVIRIAGNVIAPDVTGSIQYAHQHLGTKLMVILGHEDCGAVKAALAARFTRAKHPERIRRLVAFISPGVRRVDPAQTAARLLQAGVEANVRWSMHQLNRTPEMQRAYREKGNIVIVGAVYELATGRVRWLEPNI
jgi:carbonic anhydrase